MQIGVVLSTILIFLSCFLCDSFQATQEYIRKRIYGIHNGAAFDIYEHTEDLLKTICPFNRLGKCLYMDPLLIQMKKKSLI